MWRHFNVFFIQQITRFTKKEKKILVYTHIAKNKSEKNIQRISGSLLMFVFECMHEGDAWPSN